MLASPGRSAKPPLLPASQFLRAQFYSFLILIVLFLGCQFSLFRFEKTAGVDDIAKGVDGVASLAKSNPDKAVNNAE
jgi:hypothetical protein